MINISKLNKSEVLQKLYNASQPLGLGTLHFTPEDLTKEEAEELLKEQTYFDYLKGRVMKVNLGGDELDPWLYDRDNGQGAAAKALGI
jgi:hypothetical protein